MFFFLRLLRKLGVWHLKSHTKCFHISHFLLYEYHGTVVYVYFFMGHKVLFWIQAQIEWMKNFIIMRFLCLFALIRHLLDCISPGLHA